MGLNQAVCWLTMSLFSSWNLIRLNVWPRWQPRRPVFQETHYPQSVCALLLLSTILFSPSNVYDLIIVFHLWICFWQEAPPPGCYLMADWGSSNSFSDSYHSRHAGRGRVLCHTAQYVVFRIRLNWIPFHLIWVNYIVAWSFERL